MTTARHDATINEKQAANCSKMLCEKAMSGTCSAKPGDVVEQVGEGTDPVTG